MVCAPSNPRGEGEAIPQEDAHEEGTDDSDGDSSCTNTSYISLEGPHPGTRMIVRRCDTDDPAGVEPDLQYVGEDEVPEDGFTTYWTAQPSPPAHLLPSGGARSALGWFSGPIPKRTAWTLRAA